MPINNTTMFFIISKAASNCFALRSLSFFLADLCFSTNSFCSNIILSQVPCPNLLLINNDIWSKASSAIFLSMWALATLPIENLYALSPNFLFNTESHFARIGLGVLDFAT